MVVAVVNSLVSLYYYLRIVREMYVGDAAEAGTSPLAHRGVRARLGPLRGHRVRGRLPAPLMDAAGAAVGALAPFL